MVSNKTKLVNPFLPIDVEFKAITDNQEAQRKAAQPKKALRIIEKVHIVKKESAG